MRKRRIPQERLDEMLTMRGIGCTYSEIGDMFDCSAPAAYWALNLDKRREQWRKQIIKQSVPSPSKIRETVE